MSTQLTPEQLARVEANKQQALERRRQASLKTVDKQEQQQQPERQSKGRLRATKMSSGYYEYNLSTMRDTKAGFLEEEKQADSPEKKRKLIMLDEIPYDPSIHGDNPKCCECDSLDLEVTYLKVFSVKVCKPCIEQIPDKYSLLTKTEAKQDYLLTDGELRDRKLFPVWEKPNPHKSTWNNMLLYLRRDLEAFAIKKWGGLEALDKEFERRAEDKRARKEKKYKKAVADLRRRTRADEWEKRRRERLRMEEEHEHTFEAVPSDGDSCEQKCSACGLVIEVEEF
ncbi:DNA repair protein rad14 [Coemansia spiralis]|uniref:DNA repair protein rad14 n=2 Tax=Coemansia TaxID=4863 RepID=A0A9W8G5H5_9FUNG|nr:XPA protein C-terminus-domain-containing protein [Coemansia spiralis]KAJ1993671.1 DNA repair protein rad14 [Coemansia umbellata]KAJ2679427.1 DNA repair protein rad14 [Coemansia spiralis]